MKRIIIVHGWSGSSERDWMPWTAAKLKELGYEVVCPDFPNTDNPKIEEWVPFLAKTAGTVNEETYFIGHSIGCQTIMRYLETIDTKVGGAIFVAGWFDLENLEGPESEAIAKPWIETPVRTEKIKNNLGFSTIILGDNDPFVPYDKTRDKFGKLLSSEVATISGGGHITSDDGFGPFPQLIEVVKEKIG